PFFFEQCCKGPQRDNFAGALMSDNPNHLQGKALINFATGNPGRQRENCGPAGDGGRGTDDDCTADDCVLGCGGLGCGMVAACWSGAGAGGADDIFCGMSTSTAFSADILWANCPCLA